LIYSGEGAIAPPPHTEGVTMGKQAYVCPKCGNRVVVFLTPTAPPSCENYEKHHSTRYVEMLKEEG
jgi:DNA-directed RNA polymerase subunit RPC12/RpoP